MAKAPVDIDIKVKGLSSLQKLERSMEDLDKDTSKLTNILPKASNNVRKLGASSRTAAQGIEKASKAAKQAETRFGKLGAAALVAFKGFVAFQGLKFLVNSAAEVERLQVQLTTLTGSLDNAKIVYEQLDKINKKSPFGTQELVGAAATLRGFGIRLENLVSTTESLGKISAATGRDIQGIALAYGQVRAKGRLQGEELLQFQERGIPLVAELAKQFGVQEDAISDLVSKGKVGFKEVQTAIANLTSETGKFGKAFENTADTTFARLSNFQDSLTKLAASVFSLFEPVFKWVVDNLTKVINLIDTAVKRFNRVKGLTPEKLQDFRSQAADEANEKFGFFNLSGDKSKFFNQRLNELVDGATGGAIKLDLSFDAPELPKIPGINGGSGSGSGSSSSTGDDLAKQLQDQIAAGEALSKQFARQNELLKTRDNFDKKLLRNQYQYEDAVQKIINTAAPLQQEGLISQAAVTKDLQDLEVLTEAATDFGRAFGEATAAKLPEVNDELTQTEELLQGAYNIVANNLTSGIQGLIDGTKEWSDVLSDVLGQLGSMFLNAGFKGLGSGLGLSFDGGGYTGSGARSGGVDGKGGFPAIIHPQETVVDHTRPASAQAAMSRYSSGGGKGAAPVLNMSFQTTTFGGKEFVDREQLEAAMQATRQQAAKEGAAGGHAKTMSTLKNSRSSRTRLGM